MAKNDACDDGAWYQLGFPEPEREEYLALHAERPTEVGPADSRALLEGFDFLVLVSYSFFRMGERPVVVIWRRNGAVDVIVRSADCAVDQRRTLGGTAARSSCPRCWRPMRTPGQSRLSPRIPYLMAIAGA